MYQSGFSRKKKKTTTRKYMRTHMFTHTFTNTHTYTYTQCLFIYFFLLYFFILRNWLITQSWGLASLFRAALFIMAKYWNTPNVFSG